MHATYLLLQRDRPVRKLDQGKLRVFCFDRKGCCERGAFCISAAANLKSSMMNIMGFIKRHQHAHHSPQQHSPLHHHHLPNNHHHHHHHRHSRHLFLVMALPFLFLAHVLIVYDTKRWWSILTAATTMNIPAEEGFPVYDDTNNQSSTQLYGLVSTVREFVSTTTTNHNNKNHDPQKESKKDDIGIDHDDDDEFAAACLFIRDDEQKNAGNSNEKSHRQSLAEWLAYHYQIVPLRYLIVATNTAKRGKTTSDVLQRYQQRLSHHSNNNNSRSMTIVEWSDEDYLTKPIVHKLIPPPRPTTSQEREGIFYFRCLQAMQEQQRRTAVPNNSRSAHQWTWLAHVDEYLALSPQLRNPQGASSSKSVVSPTLLASVKQKQQQRDATSPCMSMTYQLGMVNPETSSSSLVPASSTRAIIPPDWDTSGLQTIHATQPDDTALQQRRRWIQQRHSFLLDITQLSPSDLVPPLRAEDQTLLCRRLNRSFKSKKGDNKDNGNHQEEEGNILQVIKLIRQPPQKKEKKKKVKPSQKKEKEDDAASTNRNLKVNHYPHLISSGWLPSFIQRVGEPTARDLLLQDSSLVSTTQSNKQPIKSSPSSPSSTAAATPEALPPPCALLFFGLPRAYGSLVLPSIQQNILIPNARHGCDVYVHYYHVTAEPSGRKNSGGTIDPTAILKLADAVHLVARNYPNQSRGSNSHSGSKSPRPRVPHVEFTHDTDDAFWYLRNATVQKYRKTKDKKGQLVYFPFNAVSYEYPSSLDNIVKQWHSIESVWNLMERAVRHGVANSYTRVALFRNDVMYVTPIDIYRTSFDDQDDDVQGRYAVIPPFGLYPVNDRMVYGPYDAVKIWATKRFEYIEDHVRKMPWGPGFGMHSELFLQRGILAAMERETGVNVTMNPDVCFFRTRADESIMISDCEVKGSTMGILTMNKQQVIRDISGFSNCTKYSMGPPFEAIKCATNK